KYRHQLFEYAALYDEKTLAAYLLRYGKYEQARSFQQQAPALRLKHLRRYEMHNFKDILRECDRHGVDHRNPMNLTSLMAAAFVGNLPLIEALLERGANIELTDHLGRNALHWAMSRVFSDPDHKYAKQVFAQVYESIAPPSVDVKVGERLVRIDRHLSEYFLFQAMWALFKFRFSITGWGEWPAFDTAALLAAFEPMPAAVLTEKRRQRQHLSAVLSRNEVDRDYAYNRRLFKRMKTGWYQFNPKLAVRFKNAEGEAWTPIYTALNLPLIKECAEPRHWSAIDQLLVEEVYEPVGVPVAGEPFLAEQSRFRHGASF
ncbi:MAG: ankyrin repeat domain-containing protein, partial [Methylococcaceae bacterium]|nr:ankyrin repeat domain-containing protein [Methylococcaceae bacterium]